MSTKLITRAGHEQLQAELHQLWKVERPDVTLKVTWAASLGDRSENADYQYNKKRLREIDRRVRYLTKSLELLRIVDYVPEQEGRVFFGACAPKCRSRRRLLTNRLNVYGRDNGPPRRHPSPV